MGWKRALFMLFLSVIGLRHLMVNIVRTVATLLIFIATLNLYGTLFASTHLATTRTLDFATHLTQPASNCVELIVNGGFEQTSLGWDSIAGASLFTYSTDQSVGGKQSILLGLTAPLNITATFGVEQLLTLPAESSSLEIAFSYDIEVYGEASLGDQAFLSLYDVSNNQLAAIVVLEPTNGAWHIGRYDLTPLAGKNVRLVFSTQSDGEVGSLSMYVDDVSVLACLPPDALVLQPLPTMTAQPTEPLLVSPQPSPASSITQSIASTLTPASPPVVAVPATVIAPQAPSMAQPIPITQTKSVFPQAGSVKSLDACRCDSTLYTCSDFSSWSVAQACYTQCQVTAGYDIHNLDEDRNGIACELELQDVSSLEATPSPQPMPSLISDTTSIRPDVSTGVTGVMTITDTTSSLPLHPPAVVAPVITTTDATTTSTVPITAVNSLTLSAPSTIAIAAAPVELAGNAQLPNTTPQDAPINPASSATPLSAIEMLSLLLFSPLGYIALGALVIVGSLSLWVAYMVGQRGRTSTAPPATHDPMDFHSPNQS